MWIGLAYKQQFLSKSDLGGYFHLLSNYENCELEKKYKQNIISIVKLAKNSDAKIILVKYPNWNVFDKILDEISIEYNIPAVDTKERISNYLTKENYYNYFMKDDHPKEEVYRQIAISVYNKLKEMGIINE